MATDKGKAVKGYTSVEARLSAGEAVAQGLGFTQKRIAVKSHRGKLHSRYLDAGSVGDV